MIKSFIWFYNRNISYISDTNNYLSFSLQDYADAYSSYMQKHWTCPKCEEQFVVTVIERIQHEQDCAQRDTDTQGESLVYFYLNIFNLCSYFQSFVRMKYTVVLIYRLVIPTYNNVFGGKYEDWYTRLESS